MSSIDLSGARTMRFSCWPVGFRKAWTVASAGMSWANAAEGIRTAIHARIAIFDMAGIIRRGIWGRSLSENPKIRYPKIRYPNPNAHLGVCSDFRLFGSRIIGFSDNLRPQFRADELSGRR